jgi:cobalt/nickel transport system permease protein
VTHSVTATPAQWAQAGILPALALATMALAVML